jgi:hypothetical protein
MNCPWCILIPACSVRAHMLVELLDIRCERWRAGSPPGKRCSPSKAGSPWSQLWSHSSPSSTGRSHSPAADGRRDTRGDAPRERASDDLLSVRTGWSEGALTTAAPSSTLQGRH